MDSLGLSEKHTEQVRLFMKFFRTKRETALKVLEAEFEDAKKDSLAEEMYTKHDVGDILDGVRKIVRENFRFELSKDLNMTVLLLKQIFEEADRQRADLYMDIAHVEDQSLLEEIERMRLDQTLGPVTKGANKLVSIKDEHNRIMSEAARHEETTKQMQERLQRLQIQCDDIMRERNMLTEKIRQIGEEKSESKAGEGHLRRELDETKAVLRDAEEEATRRLNESKQFQQLKKLMANKNEQIRDLRRRLQKYEPDVVRYDHEDDP